MNLIICQSPKYLVASINKYKETSNSKLVVRETEGVFNFIKDNHLIDLNDLLFLAVHKRSSFLGLLYNFIAIKSFCNYFKEGIDDVFIFTNEHDFSTISILSRIDVNGSIYIEKYTQTGSRGSSYINFLNRCIFGVVSFYNNDTPCYIPNNSSYLKFRAWKGHNVNASNKFSLLGLKRKDRKQLLIIDSNDQTNKNLQFVESIYSELLKVCNENNIQVVVKGHPRLGVSSCLMEHEEIVYIDKDIPLEFLSLCEIDFITGFYSSALVIPSLIARTKSLLILSKSNKENYYKDYLLDNGFDKRGFVSRVEDVIFSSKESL